MKETTFEEMSLHETVKSILANNRYKNMTEVQQKSIPYLIKQRDVVVQSQTGTGKTLSFVVPVVNDFYKNTRRLYPITLVISPTRELALQIGDVFNMFQLNTKCFIGGINIQEDMQYDNMDVIVGTPGRLLEICKNKPVLFNRISYLILDEADILISLGFKDKVLDIVSYLPKTKLIGCFSATINDDLRNLSKSVLKNPVFITCEGSNIPEHLSIKYIVVDSDKKLSCMMNLCVGKRCIIFLATCGQVNFLYALLTKSNQEHEIVQENRETILKEKSFKETIFKIHRKMKQEDRTNVYKQFCTTGKILLCTDIAARGIDFKQVDLVIHFDIPSDFSNLIHRSGRTARNGVEGSSVLFVMPNELSYLEYIKIKKVEIDEIKHIEVLQPCITDYKSFMTDGVLDLSVRAFVSYIRYYKEHKLSYLLDYTTLDYDRLVEMFMLTKIPGMVELRNVKFKKFPREVQQDKKKKHKKVTRKN